MSIVQFVNREQLEGERALEALVGHYRHFMRTPFENPFDNTKASWVWGACSWALLGRFIKREKLDQISGTRGDIPEAFLLPKDSLELVQALVLHARITQNKNKSALVNWMNSVVCLESILRQRNKKFSALSVYDLNETVEKYGFATKYLESFVSFLGSLGIIKSQAVLQWVNPIRSSQSKRNYKKTQVGEQASEEYKLPNHEAVMAVCKYFRDQPWITRGESVEDLDDDFRNVIVGSYLSIIMMVPCRIQDIEQLSRDCLVNKKDGDATVWGIDWYSSKTDMDHIKWIPYTAGGEFVNVVREAIERIKVVTEPARQVFRTWDCECAEYNPSAYREAQAKGWLPKKWPYFSEENNVRYSEALFVQLKYQSNSKRNTVNNIALRITKDNFRNWLTSSWKTNAHTKEKHSVYVKSFFERIGCEDLELNVDDYNSHSFRHMVNTAARLGGMSEFDVNWWSHRREMGEVYDHRTTEQKFNLIATGDYQARELSPEERLERINNNLPMTRKNLGLKFEIVTNASGGFTLQHPLGTCTHNYSESPCPKNVNCIECEENAYCKGDKRTLKNLKEALDEINSKIEMAGSQGDDFGLRRLSIKHELVSALVDILGDESPLEDGAMIMLSKDKIVETGLVSRAKALADQIESGTNILKIKHADAIKQLGIVRVLPLISSADEKETIKNELLLDEFMLGLEEDDE